jgi:hypothetical protein
VDDLRREFHGPVKKVLPNPPTNAPKPDGNAGTGRSEERDNGCLAQPAVVRSAMGAIPDTDGPPANLKLPNQPLAVRWDSMPFTAWRMSSNHFTAGREITR